MYFNNNFYWPLRYENSQFENSSTVLLSPFSMKGFQDQEMHVFLFNFLISKGSNGEIKEEIRVNFLI